MSGNNELQPGTLYFKGFRGLFFEIDTQIDTESQEALFTPMFTRNNNICFSLNLQKTIKLSLPLLGDRFLFFTYKFINVVKSTELYLVVIKISVKHFLEWICKHFVIRIMVI